jgi:hypothetical protein
MDCANGVIMNPDLRAKLDSANEHYEAQLRAETDRATYLLATMIIGIGDVEPHGRRAEVRGF